MPQKLLGYSVSVPKIQEQRTVCPGLICENPVNTSHITQAASTEKLAGL